MNPRFFCRERSYHKALLLTYSFDPIFFEQVVLHDLWAGRSSDILVLGDADQITTSTQAAAGQLWHLGKHYLLAGARHGGSFHPKVLLRLGAKDGVVMIGSGNVTSSGWGGNQEIGTAWMIGPEHADNGSWLHAFLDDVLSWCSGELELDAVRRMKDVPWLSLTPSARAVVTPVLHSSQARALGPAIAQRWTGRRFDEVKILTGSTDESGAFLRWAHAMFGIKRATVAITPTMARFVLDRLADLPLELRLIAALADRPLHAKLYWFDGPDGPAAVMGSANCSASAWILPPDQGGNVETMVVYDQPSGEEFESALSTFNLPSQTPGDLLLPRAVTGIAQPISKREFELTSLRWDSSMRTLYASIFPMPSSEMSVDLVLAGNQLAMSPSHGSEAEWQCDLAEGIGSATAFASIRIRSREESWTTSPRWINDLAELHHASQAARLLEPFKELERNASSAEQRQMLDELQEVAQALFNDSPSFRDPGFGSGRNDKAAEEAPATPVNPSDLVFHLEEHQPLPHFESTRPGSLSLTGIVRLLFEAEADEGISSAAAQGEGPDEGAKKKRDKRTPQPAPIEDRLRERLAAQITNFIVQMSSREFAGRCTATQMVQAVSFPLAVALRGKRRGWVTAELAEKWALEVFSVLFRGNGHGAGGLLRAVEQRYVQNEQKPTFDYVVGDGTLWMVLVATLGNANWHGISTDIDKAVALREVFRAPQLLASAQPSRVARLLGKIRIDDARSYLAEVAPAVTHLLNEIERLLVPVWDAEMRAQTDRAISHKVGDLLWREKVGWAVCLVAAGATSCQPVRVRLRGFEKDVMGGYYVNVSELASRSTDLERLVHQLRITASTPGRATPIV